MSQNTPSTQNTQKPITLEDIYAKQCEIEAQNAEMKKAVISEPSKAIEAVKGAGINFYFLGKAGLRNSIDKVKDLGSSIKETIEVEAIRTGMEHAAMEQANKEIDAVLVKHGLKAPQK